MIKNLLNADEEIPVKPPKDAGRVSLFDGGTESEILSEPSEKSNENFSLTEPQGAGEIEGEHPSIVVDRERERGGFETRPFRDESDQETPTIFVAGRDRVHQPNEYPADPPAISFKPPSKAEVIRRSGLAWSAGVVFFGSVVFMLILGWFADLLFGSSPIGLVGGIVIGSIIGFVQLFRISSQILRQ